jgi:hypothetical protein
MESLMAYIRFCGAAEVPIRACSEGATVEEVYEIQVVDMFGERFPH